MIVALGPNLNDAMILSMLLAHVLSPKERGCCGAGDLRTRAEA